LDYHKPKKAPGEVVGLVPAGGKALRMAPLPCSKELYPVGFHPIGSDRSLRPKVAAQYLLEKFKFANINKAYIILRNGKWDIPAYFGDGEMLNMHFAYLMMNAPFGVPYTLDQAYPFVENSIVALGFPDILFQPEDAFVKLLAKLDESQADIVLGVFPAPNPHKTDMVELGPNGQIRSITIKPVRTKLVYAWELAVWRPKFTRFMHDYILPKRTIDYNNECSTTPDIQQELYVGDIIQEALVANLKVEGVIFKDGSCLDIGTPEDMRKAVQEKI
jgi:glucose-1-phosphate thymidylyltransferase